MQLRTRTTYSGVAREHRRRFTFVVLRINAITVALIPQESQRLLNQVS
jgi:hypothetical protein